MSSPADEGTDVEIDESEMRAKSVDACMTAADGLLTPARKPAHHGPGVAKLRKVDGYLVGKREQARQYIDLAFARGDADAVAKWLKVIEQIDAMTVAR